MTTVVTHAGRDNEFSRFTSRSKLDSLVRIDGLFIHRENGKRGWPRLFKGMTIARDVVQSEQLGTFFLNEMIPTSNNPQGGRQEGTAHVRIGAAR